MTLQEIAKKLGLSTSTVSRALTRPNMVAAPTRKRVMELVERHGYTPNAIARSLRSGVTKSVGVIVSDILNPFHAGVTKAIEQVVTARGYTTIICNSDEDPALEMRAFGLLAQLQVAGVIHASSGSSAESLAELGRWGVPTVGVDRATDLPTADSVLVDNVRGSREAVEHLLNLGHTRVATVAGPQNLTTGRERLTGYQQALEARGLPTRSEYVTYGDFREASGRAAAERLFSLPEPPTAMFVANNEMTAGVIEACRELGVAVPRDLALVSFDDARWARYLDPPLTVVAQPVSEIGSAAAELLFSRMHGRTERVKKVLRTELLVRGSCAAPSSRSE